MKSERKLKLAFIKLISDPNTFLTGYHISNDIEIICDPENPRDIPERKLTGHSKIIIDIFREPKK